MSHELSTPLNAIIGFSEVMEQQMLRPDRDGEICRICPRHPPSGQFLLDVINDILDMSKIEAGRMQLELARFDVGGDDRGCAADDSRRARSRAASRSRGRCRRASTIAADRRALKQVLINILANARQVHPGRRPGNGATVRTPGGATEITISDTGIGIPSQATSTSSGGLRAGREPVHQEQGPAPASASPSRSRWSSSMTARSRSTASRAAAPR